MFCVHRLDLAEILLRQVIQHPGASLLSKSCLEALSGLTTSYKAIIKDYPYFVLQSPARPLIGLQVDSDEGSAILAAYGLFLIYMAVGSVEEAGRIMDRYLTHTLSIRGQ
ncbi:hypothetical protein GMRT_23773 [Giardia muris]|nr:hypothetical protein GMRT_23773 [Giardia muris]|eukprot:TNJ26790.1 hypothetical protein GMRT_23773 [Giardia muris]